MTLLENLGQHLTGFRSLQNTLDDALYATTKNKSAETKKIIFELLLDCGANPVNALVLAFTNRSFESSRVRFIVDHIKESERRRKDAK